MIVFDIDMNTDTIYWNDISNQYLPEEFIRKYHDKVNWFIISRCQKLSENFIVEFQDRVDWGNISYFQKLSRKFIKNNFDKLNIKFLLENENISEEIKQELQIYSEIL